MKPVVSIGIPFKDPGILLLDAIKSVFCQTIDNWELILLNDGSQDISVDIASKVKDERVIFINDNKSLGLPKRLNQIAEIARGQFLARMDADDLMHPMRLEKQVLYLQNNPGVDVVDTGAVIINDDRKPVGMKKNILDGIENKYLVALKSGLVLHPSILARREWFVNHKYDPGYPRAEDRELFVRTIKTSVVEHISEPLYYYYYSRKIRLKAYLESYCSERKVLLKYGPDLVGRKMTALLYVRSLLKSAAIPIITTAGMDYVVTSRIQDNLSVNVLNETMKFIQLIKQTRVPGCEGFAE